MADRITLNDNAESMIVKLSEGVPGAVAVLVEMLERGAEIDPHSFAGRFSGLLKLDSIRIYGSDIWTLYKRVCDEDIVKTLAVLRAQQLGIIRSENIHAAIKGGMLNPDGILEQVRERLPNFATGYPPTPQMAVYCPPGQEEEIALGEILLKGGVAREYRRRDDGSFVRYNAEGKIHCDGAPAVRDKDGNEAWFEHGKRLPGPKAVLDADLANHTPEQVIALAKTFRP